MPFSLSSEANRTCEECHTIFDSARKVKIRRGGRQLCDECANKVQGTTDTEYGKRGGYKPNDGNLPPKSPQRKQQRAQEHARREKVGDATIRDSGYKRIRKEKLGH